MTESAVLDVTIIGAGIAGLFAARILREKHNVTLLEKSAGGNEVGAAVTPGPNATRWLDKYGWDRQKAAAISLNYARTYDHGGNLVREQDVSNIKELFGSDWYVVHRIDLWTELLRLATAPSADLGVSGNPAKIVWRANVTDVDVETGDVSLEDGTVIPSDLVVGADGVKSMVRPLVTGVKSQPRASGASMFRFMLPRAVVESITADPAMAGLATKPEICIRMASDGSGRSVVSYPCRNHELLNVGCIAPDTLINLPMGNSWSSPGHREDLLRVFGDFAARPILEKAEDIKLWELRDHDPLETYVRGRTVLIGDAAHAMTPHQGQGASQAIEDGEGLTLFIDRTTTRQTVADVLRDFDRVRRVRASKIQAITRSVHKVKTPTTMFRNQAYNYTYHGIQASLALSEAGEEF